MVVEARPEDTYDVQLKDDSSTIKATRDELVLVRPEKKDHVIILVGANAGATGLLIGIDVQDGIVKMSADGDIQIVQLESCAVLDTH